MPIELEILSLNYWEHYKFAKDLSLILPPDHPKRIKLDKAMDNMLKEMNNLKLCL